jgi:uncharacterized protein YciI
MRNAHERLRVECSLFGQRVGRKSRLPALPSRDDGAISKRLASCEDHKRFLINAAVHGVTIVMSGPPTTDDAETMIGSVLLVEASNREAVDRFNSHDPCFSAGIWENVAITAFSRRQG